MKKFAMLLASLCAACAGPQVRQSDINACATTSSIIEQSEVEIGNAAGAKAVAKRVFDACISDKKGG